MFATAAANARRYYEEGKAAREKEAKTHVSAAKSLKYAQKAAEASAAKAIAAASALRTIKVARKPAWYERFHWFITLEGLIVVGGRNAADNELLVKRYLRPQDAYVHADVHGASSVILRNPSRDPADAAALPRYALSLQQAGNFCINLSAAWSSHIPTSAWWVHAEQVSKTAPTGEYLTTGAFMIRGRKNLLPLVKLELGLALLWKVDESCTEKHARDRYVRGTEAADAVDESLLVDRAEPVLLRSVSASTAGTADDSVRGGDVASVTASLASVAMDDGTASRIEAAAPSSSDDDSEEEKVVDEEDDEEGEEEARGDDDSSVDAEGEGSSSDVEDEATPAAAVDAGAGDAAAVNAGASATSEHAGAVPTVGGAVPAHVRRAAKKLEKMRGLKPADALAQALVLHSEKSSSSSSAHAAAGDADAEEGEGKGEAHEADAGHKEKATPMSAAAVYDASNKRGHRGKAKKMKSKYAEQDEEDRIAAMTALGHAPVKPDTSSKGGKGGKSGSGKGDARAGASSIGGGSKATAGAAGAGAAGAPRAPRAPRAPKADAAGGEEAGAGASLLVTEGDDAQVSSLVMTPLADDIVLHVVPMLCPWSVASACKYRVKLTPGALKRGKATQAALHLLNTAAKGSGMPREADLIKAVTDAEVTALMIAGVKVSASGAATDAAHGGKKHRSG